MSTFIKFPPQTSGGAPVHVPHPSRAVVIGANGSGKTRFGIWIEDNNQSQTPVHRISAQKALTLPDYAQLKNLEQAEKELYLGRSDQHASLGRKVLDRWGGNPATHVLSDYDKLLALLFAKDADRDRRHTQQTRQAQSYLPVPDSPIDQIAHLWSYLMPHRTIAFHDGKVVVGKGTLDEYHAKEMSDGERVTLYLLGQCLTAPTGAVIIVDEPELHLHRSLMDKLWNRVEELCPDKSLVYITHDLDFAASRTAAKKVWVTGYSKEGWTWSDLPEDQCLPENLLLELIGSRKPVLFCEGDRGGLDHTLYQICYPGYHVIPRGSGEKVVESVKALRANSALHTISAFGIIDRDVRTPQELDAHLMEDIHALPFAEVENLLCTECLVAAVGEQLQLDPSETVAKATAFVAQSMRDELEAQIVMRAARRVRYHLSCYSPTTVTRTGLQSGVDKLVNSLDMASITAEAELALNEALNSGKLDEMLKLYNRKSLADRVSSCFGLKHGEYKALVFRMLKGPRKDVLIGGVRAFLPSK